jgi:hypothetical protein
VILAIGAVVAVVLGRYLFSALRGDWVNLDTTGTLLMALRTPHMRWIGEVTVLAALCGVVGLIITGAIRNVRARRSTTVVERLC